MLKKCANPYVRRLRQTVAIQTTVATEQNCWLLLKQQSFTLL